MPIYEFLCPKCDYKFSRRRPISESGEDMQCPKCQTPAKKQFSSFAAVSKGPGGGTMPIASDGCGGCSGGTCSTCGS